MVSKADTPDHIIVFDGVCKLCNGFVNFVLAHDKHQRFHFCAAQSELGSQLMAVAGAGNSGDPLLDYQSVLLVQNWGHAQQAILQKSRAFFAIMAELGWPWRGLTLFRFVPAILRDWVYDRVAKNRYRLFGRYEMCRLPSESEESRFVS